MSDMDLARIDDRELADICDRNGFPSVGDRLAIGQTQEQATAYMVSSASSFYNDGEGQWLKAYVSKLHNLELAGPR